MYTKEDSRELFVVSNERGLWKKGVSCVFILEPYVYHKMQIDNSVENYQSVTVASRRRNSKEHLERDNDYVNQKYEYYAQILTHRLNDIHQLDFDTAFWKKCLSMGFLRYITLVHDAFMSYELYFNEETHDCNILAKKSFTFPSDFEEQRNLLQYSDIGQEQLFSLYLNLFYPEEFSSQNLCKTQIFQVGLISRLRKAKKKIFKKARMLRQLSVRRAITILSSMFSQKKVIVGIYGAYFSRNFLDQLRLESKGKIKVINRVSKKYHKKKISQPLRKKLSESKGEFDRFDLFFFNTIESLFPSALLEDFETITKAIEYRFRNYNSLKYLVSESWMGNTIDSISLALMKTKKVDHIYNEHNALFYPWSGTMVETRANLVDIYYTMGWDDKSILNLKKGASLFEFSLQVQEPRTIKFPMTLISNVRFAKIPEYSSAYGFCAENVERFAEYTKQFYDSLVPDIKSRILYRGPRPGYEGLLSYDNDFLLKPHLSQVLIKDTSDLTGKEVIASSGLVIVDYFATSFLEALHMNVPTIVLLNREIYYLKDGYDNLFDELIDAGICQEEPKAAALFIDSICGSVDQWWWNTKTQIARKNFLDKSFGKPQEAIQFYLSLLKKKPH